MFNFTLCYCSSINCFSEIFVRKLPDSPDTEWDKDVLEKEILAVVYGLQPNKVLTFIT